MKYHFHVHSEVLEEDQQDVPWDEQKWIPQHDTLSCYTERDDVRLHMTFYGSQKEDERLIVTNVPGSPDAACEVLGSIRPC